MLSCFLFASAMAFPVSTWRSKFDFEDRHGQLDGVSIILLKAPFLDEDHVRDYPIEGILEQQGYDLHEPYIVKDIYDIFDSLPTSFTGTYYCDKNTTFSPPQCLSEGKLLFNFTFIEGKKNGPVGEIRYNYAFFPEDTSEHIDVNLNQIDMKSSPHVTYRANPEVYNNSLCYPATTDLNEGWRLAYYRMSIKKGKGNTVLNVNATSPWKGCTTPIPWFDPHVVKIC